MSESVVKVLIVDDEAGLLEIARIYLQKTDDIIAEEATSGKKALEMIRQEHFDVIVSDYQMPGMDGLQLLQAMMAEGFDIPFILFTGKGREDIAVSALNLGATFYLQKGGDPKAQFAELSNMVRRAASNKWAERRLIESENRFRTLFHESPEMYILMENDVFVDCNRATETHLGFAREQIIGKSPLVFAPPVQHDGTDTKIALERNTAKATKEGSNQFEWTTLDINGEAHIFDISLTSMKQSRGNLVIATMKDITEHKKAEDRLRISEQRFRSVVTNTHAISVLIDKNDIITLMEGKGLSDLGQQPGFGVGRPASILLLDYTDHIERTKSLGKGEEERFEAIIQDMVYDVTLTPLFNDDGQFDGMIGVANNITESARMAEERNLNSMRMQALLELNQMTDRPLSELATFAMEEAVRLTNSSIGYIAFMNEDETVQTMHAWSKQAMRECMISDKPFDYPVEKTGLWGEAVRQRKAIITNDYSAPNQFKKGTPEGHVHMKRHMNVPIFDHGKIVIVAGVGNKEAEYDLTDIRELTLLMEGMWRLVRRKRAEEKLRENEERLATIIDLLPDPTMVVNDRGIVLAWNKAMEEMTGIDAEEIMGKGDMEYAMPFYGYRRPLLIDYAVNKNVNVLAKYSSIKQDGDVVTAETIPLTVRGKDVVVWARASPFYDTQGKVLGAIETIRDVTEWKRTQAALMQSNRQLNTLSDITRHDILNLLTVLQGHVVLANSRTSDEAFKTHLRQEDALLQKIEDQIRFTKLYQSLGLAEPSWQSLNTIVERMQPPKGVVVVKHCDGFEVFADPMLPRAFDNLFENAIRHGEKITRIEISANVRDKLAVIKFQDDGVGIPADEKHPIFNRGYGKNTGLGLFLVREILAITGMTINETGNAGKGACFEITVPSGNYRLTE